MKGIAAIVSIPAIILLAACAGARDKGAMVDELLAVDTEFAHYSVQHGASEAFDKFLADEAVWLPIEIDAVHGRHQIADQLRPLDDGWILDWKPTHATVSDDGSLGYTWGHYELYKRESVGEKVVGKYLTVWRAGADGRWRAIADIGNRKPVAGD